MSHVVSDFEAAVWSVAKEVQPGVLQRGCAFHFSQAVWRNIQAVGLQCAYTSDERVNRVCRQTMALPFLFAEAIADEFQTLHTASDDPRVARHLQYMERQWISSTTWPPTTWSVFCQPVQTNNDVEGWHCPLNDKASHGQLNLYKLIHLLYAQKLHFISYHIRDF